MKVLRVIVEIEMECPEKVINNGIQIWFEKRPGLPAYLEMFHLEAHGTRKFSAEYVTEQRKEKTQA